jgi:TM2 domain-containing membrane protein YozV
LIMKKYIIAPFCSAFIVPGLGQIINEQIKKGLLLLGLVFILLVAVTVKLAVVINRLMADVDLANIDLKEITEKMMSEDLSLISILALCFAGIWIYSIIDALWTGWKIERGKAHKKDEILSD